MLSPSREIVLRYFFIVKANHLLLIFSEKGENRRGEEQRQERKGEEKEGEQGEGDENEGRVGEKTRLVIFSNKQ